MSAPAGAIRDGIGVWVDGLRRLDPNYLRRHFRPQAQGVDPRTIALAVRGDATLTEHLLRHAPPELSAAMRPHLAGPAGAAEVLQAQLRVVSVYFWEMVYNGHPDVYERFSVAQDPPLEEMFPIAEARGGDVADIGTGGGRVLRHLSGHARRLWGVDPSRSMRELARRRVGTRAVVALVDGGFADLPLPDASVDLVVSAFAYQTSEERGGKRGLAEIRRILRPGTRALLAVGNPATATYLRRLGLPERTLTRPVRWTAPKPPVPVILHRLFELAKVRFVDGVAWTPVWVFEVAKGAET